jgi:uncharacterized protein (DUF433 family)
MTGPSPRRTRSRPMHSLPDTPGHHPIIDCDPRRQFGQPCVAGTRTTVDAVAQSVWQHSAVDEVAAWYEIDPLDVWWSCAWWSMHRHDLRRHTPRGHRWRRWAEHHAVGVLAGWVKGDITHPDEWTWFG